MSVKRAPYPKPGAVGGRLIRQVISVLRNAEVPLPLSTSHILIATSGGVDSIALALLLAKYGRRVVGASSLELLHVNHGWRGKESDADERFVKAFGKKLGLTVHASRLQAPKPDGRSWEEVAREERKAIYARFAKQRNAVILTGHHADDLAETLLWRLFTGAFGSHGGGIGVQHGVEIRPFLQIRKRDLQKFLEEERQTWREDRTNVEGRFLRSKMRMRLMPIVEELFPRSVEHLVKVALEAQTRQRQQAPEVGDALNARGIHLRRPHWEAIQEKASDWAGEIHLPGGWKLVRERTRERVRKSKRSE